MIRLTAGRKLCLLLMELHGKIWLIGYDAVISEVIRGSP